MGVLSRINTAVFTVPLVLSSLLLRALEATRRKPPPRQRRAHGRSARSSAAVAAPVRSVPSAANASSGEVARMRHELAAVLEAHPGSREVFRYLAHFERRLAKSGLATLETMTTKRLRRALAQFEAIVTNWSQPQLADLRSRMAVAVASRDSGAAMWAPAATISKAYAPRHMPMLGQPSRAVDDVPAGFQPSRQVEVEDDIGISRFDAAMGEWQRSEGARSMAARLPDKG
jgi:hypothetical protein